MLGFCKHLGLGMGLATAHNTITSKDSLCKWCKATGGWSRAGGFSPTLQCQGFKGHKAPPPPPAAVPSHLTTAMSPTASRKPPCEGVHSSGHPACWSGAGARAREPLGHQSPKGHHVWKQSPQTPTASRDQEKWRISSSAHGFSVLCFPVEGAQEGQIPLHWGVWDRLPGCHPAGHLRGLVLEVLSALGGRLRRGSWGRVSVLG